ncbi:MAG: sigma-70 family RNA polymerase sigma factor [bacterium]
MPQKKSTKIARYSPIVPYDPFLRYMEEIKKYPLLSKENEHELAIRYWKYKDKHAAYILITSNLLLVVKLVMEFRVKHQNVLDYIQEGNIGLLEALKRFDPYRDVRFSTYASWWIKAYILKYILDNWRMVKVGTTNKRRKLFYNLQKEKARLESMGIFPGPKLLAERLGSNEAEIIEMTQTIEQGDLSLDATTGDDERGATLIDILPDSVSSPEEETARDQIQNILSQKIEKFKEGISEREKVILEERLLEEKPATLQEIASRFRKTREAIRYTETKLIKKLKSFLKKEIPDLNDNIFVSKHKGKKN